MNQVQKGTGVKRIGRGILMGTLIASIMIMLCCVAGAALLSKEVLPERGAQAMSWGICGLGTLVGCAIAMKKSGGARLPMSLGCAGGLLLLMLLGRALLGNGTEGIWQSAVVCMAAALAAAMLGAGRRGRRH